MKEPTREQRAAAFAAWQTKLYKLDKALLEAREAREHLLDIGFSQWWLEQRILQENGQPNALSKPASAG